MAKFNTKRESKSEVKITTTLQGGTGYTQSSEKELIGILASGISNTFYEREDERTVRFKEVLKKVASKDKEFAAKALVYARTVFGQRSVTHYGAVEMIPFLSGSELAKRFFSKRDRKENRGGIVYRLDDMAEILACYQAKNGVNAPIPNAIKKGFKEAIEHADAYQLAKYQMKSRGVSLVDIVNLVHPVETKMNGTVDVPIDVYTKAIQGTKFAKSEVPLTINGIAKVPAVKALVLGILKQFNTVEDKNTEAGKVVAEKVKSGEITIEQAKAELNEAKTDNFKGLIDNKSIGYLALLRNLRNIINTNDAELLNSACEQLVDEKFIKKSLVFPHQIDLCAEVMLQEFSGHKLAKVINSLNIAYERSIPNLAELFNAGRTAVVLDVSGSMSSNIKIADHKNGSTSALSKGALVAATLAKGIGAELYVFANSCAQARYNPLDSVNTIKNSVTRGNNVGGGTSWSSIFPRLERDGKFDRIFVVSDEQDSGNVESSYRNYCAKFGTPYIYIINICGYGPTVLKESANIARIFGYNADIYETAKRVEMDVNAVITEINKIVI